MPYIGDNCQLTYGDEAFGSFGVAPTSKARSIGIVRNVDVPAPANEWMKKWAVGAGREMHAAYLGKQLIEGLGVEYDLQYAESLFHVLGAHMSSVGTTPTNGTTLNGATDIGDTSVTLASGTGYALNDYMQIGSGADAEVRQITDASGTPTFVLNRPLHFAHATALAVNEVVAPFTHTMSPGNMMVDSTVFPSFTLEVGYLDMGPDMVLQFLGCVGDGFELSLEMDEVVKVSQKYHAAKLTKQTSAEALSIDALDAFEFTEGVVEYNNVELARMTGAKISYANGGSMKHYIRGADSRYAYEYIPDHIEVGCTIDLVVDDAAIFDSTSLMDDVIDPSTSGRSLKLTLTRGATDYIELTGTLYNESYKAPVPESGEVTGSLVGFLRGFSIEAKDDNGKY